MGRCLLRCLIIANLIVFTIIVGADAQQLRNVSGPDGIQLAGKTCIGVFIGGTDESKWGANVSAFSIRGDLMIFHVWAKFGRAAYEKTVADMGKPDWKADTTGFQDQGEVRDLLIQGKVITYANVFGDKVNLTIAGGRLSGTIDPQPRLPLIATTTRDCR